MAKGISISSKPIGHVIEKIKLNNFPTITDTFHPTKQQLTKLNKILKYLTPYEKDVYIMYYGHNLLTREISLFLDKFPKSLGRPIQHNVTPECLNNKKHQNIRKTLSYLRLTKIPRIIHKEKI